MRVSCNVYPAWTSLLVVVCAAVAVNGCSRAKYRLQADREAYDVIAERNGDPRWCVDDYNIETDPRSRYFDPYDPDRPPMPPDDPTSHEYMHCVDGMTGWEHWHDNGDRIELENPGWRETLAEYVKIDADGSIELTLDSALKLAYVHSPSHQTQLETLYLSSLDVTTERFRLDTQFFGGYDTKYAHTGPLAPAQLSYDSTLGRYVVNPPTDGIESNRLTVGNPSSGDPALQVRRKFATAGELLVGFANSFVFEFTGGDANLSASLANFSFIQPLLRGAGRDIALEQLTIVERALLANLRAYSQYRQGFYTQVTIGELGVSGPRRRGGFFGGTGLTGFTGQGTGGFGGVGNATFRGATGGGTGTVGGYVGLLQQLQQIRNTEDSLSLQLRTLSLLEAHLKAGVIDLVQVDQFRQSIEAERANLLQNQNNLKLSVASYETGTLGLPPNLPVQLDDSMIRQFQLVDREATAVQDSIAQQQDRVGQLPDDAGVEEIRQVVTDVRELVAPVGKQLEDIQTDIAQMERKVPDRERTMAEEEKKLFAHDREQLHERLADLTKKLETSRAELAALSDGLSEQTTDATVRKLVVWLGDLYRLAQVSILVQARARLEAVTVESIDLDPDDAFDIALANRLDYMNARASLVDSWRLIQFNADALQSALRVTAGGDLRTARNNPMSFRAPTGNMRLGLEFDAPFTRLLERNNYRQSLIDYQRSRRRFIQSRDSLQLGLQSLLWQIQQLRTNLEIQRRAVVIAIRRVDLTRAQLYQPVPPPLPGQRPAQFGPTAATNLLTALSALRNTQNNFMSVWLNYYAARMRLARELGIMKLDHNGKWIDEPLPDSSVSDSLDAQTSEAQTLPPPVSAEWIELGNALAGKSDVTLPAAVESNFGDDQE